MRIPITNQREQNLKGGEVKEKRNNILRVNNAYLYLWALEFNTLEPHVLQIFKLHLISCSSFLQEFSHCFIIPWPYYVIMIGFLYFLQFKRV